MGLQLVDDKGRVAIPAGLRATLEKNSGQAEGSKDARVAILTTHESDPCLIAYDEPYFDLLMDRLDARELEFAGERGRSDSNIWREGVGSSENIAFDPSGRFVVPGMHADHANIGKPGYAFFYGVGKVIEIWDPRTLLAHPTAPESMKTACRYHLADKKVTL
ncbi:division/cell wall cluster transcriptional repressor MraZ [Sphingomonas sp.]|uniref:division/cell wall cluster transcriptional repressor MraZ n=1 Tax=Sphingomonas sp. TaxID=28214 RepID=UPI001EC4EBBB|nr:division/cell wall cluster transcriptional repressor MraZ [Sphingomonas sp.]MBX3594283.1 division/cell wall cluster transcriptional repressor MraZ [Sphingomonas sp.]